MLPVPGLMGKSPPQGECHRLRPHPPRIQVDSCEIDDARGLLSDRYPAWVRNVRPRGPRAWSPHTAATPLGQEGRVRRSTRQWQVAAIWFRGADPAGASHHCSPSLSTLGNEKARPLGLKPRLTTANVRQAQACPAAFVSVFCFLSGALGLFCRAKPPYSHCIVRSRFRSGGGIWRPRACPLTVPLYCFHPVLLRDRARWG